MPDHIKSASYSLPKQMNEFLIQLLQVKKKALCRTLPCNIVKPEIRPASLSRVGGPELLQKIKELTVKEHKHRQAMQTGPPRPPSPPIIRDKKYKSDGSAETAALLRKPIDNATCQKSKHTLQIELEPGVPSIKHMENRDRFEVD